MKRGLLFLLALSWACGDTTGNEAGGAPPEPQTAAPAKDSETSPDEATDAKKPDEPPEKTGPDEAQCSAFVEHMAVVSAQSYGLPAASLFNADERQRAVEHCKQFAHPRVLECGEQTQVWSFFVNCLHARAVPRPRLQTPNREDCERFRDRTLVINNAMQSKVGGYATPASNRSQERAVQTCLQSMTHQQVKCGVAAQSSLDMLSCFSPYDVGSDRTWPTAEECEAYGDHMLGIRDQYFQLPFPKPLEATDALSVSGLQTSMMPGVVRGQLVGLCHSLDRDMVQCHMAAQAVADLGKCIP